MKKIVLPARLDSWEQVYEFLNKNLDEMACSKKVRMQVLVAAEEVYVNIARYAYQEQAGEGNVSVEIGRSRQTGQITIIFTDNGIRYDPLRREDPDTTLSAEEREIGGLGIYMVKQMMDDVNYRYEDGKNILTIRKS